MSKHLLGPYSVKPKNKNFIDLFELTFNVRIDIEKSQ